MNNQRDRCDVGSNGAKSMSKGTFELLLSLSEITQREFGSSNDWIEDIMKTCSVIGKKWQIILQTKISYHLLWTQDIRNGQTKG